LVLGKPETAVMRGTSPQLRSNLLAPDVREVTLSPSHIDGEYQQSELAVDTLPLVGRATELAGLAGLLTRARLVTVLGTGGVGKTTLARHAVASIASDFADGVCVIPLSALSDGRLLPDTVAARLGLSGQDSDATDGVLSYLRDRETLLVLDTCEHLIDACAEFAEMVLEQTSRVTVLATSRQSLDVNGENIFPLLPLSVPPADGVPAAGTAVPGDATDLFARRAGAATGSFAVTAENRRDVIRVCERLDGIPLAIELAAVRLRTMPLAELARLLTDRLAISPGQSTSPHQLPAGGDDRPASGTRLAALEDASRTEARQRTLRATIGWSYDLCMPADQALWERLSVFAGSFDIAAAQEVCAGRNLPRESVAEAVFSLVDKSVIVREEPEADGRSRYRFLDTIREFGAERLAASGAEASVRDRLIARYLAKARDFDQHFLGDDQLERLRDLGSESASIQAALEYALGSEQADRAREGAELAISLCGYWAASGRLREGGYWLDKVARKFPGRTRERARALVVWSYVSEFEGKISKAVDDAREGIEIAEELGDTLVQGRGYLYLCLAQAFGGRYDESAEAGYEAERLLESVGDRIGLLCLDGHMAHMYQLSGNVDAAARRYQTFVRRSGETRERWLYGYLDVIESMSLFQQRGREADCASVVARSLLAKHEVGDILGIGYALEVFAWLAARAGRHGRCAWLLGAADILWERTGQRLSNTAALEDVHQQSARAARDALGEQRFATVYAQGRYYPRDAVVQCAVADADDLPPALPSATGLSPAR
jgi:non-specific serine/threonine protein kinase